MSEQAVTKTPVNLEHAEITIRFLLLHELPVPTKLLERTRKILAAEAGCAIDDEFLLKMANRTVKAAPQIQAAPHYKEGKTTKAISLFEFNNNHGNSKRHAVYRMIRDVNRPLTRQELSDMLAWKLSSIAGRVNELLKLGLVVVVGRKKDRDTKKSVELLGLTEWGDK